jgi:DNA-binding transcriptional MerR regulator
MGETRVPERAGPPPVAPVAPRKSPHAFRTISEAADELNVPQHVLRFWETKFPALRPMKRAGGRRYYRPADIVLLRRIADLLYTQGYTIKGVQRVLADLEPAPRPEVSAAEALAELDAVADALRRLAGRDLR